MIQFKINGENARVQSFTLNQEIDGHHKFQIDFPYVKGRNFHNHILNDQNKKISIEILDDYRSSSLIFKGLIQSSRIAVSKSNPQISIMGFDQSLVLNQGEYKRSFAKTSPADIAKKILGKNGIIATIQLPSKKQEYKVQYKENNISFLRRIAAENGCHFIFDGNSYFLTDLSNSYSGEPIDLIPNENLLFYNLTTSVVPLGGEVKGYDYTKNKKLNRTFSGDEFLGDDSFVKSMISKSKKLFINPSFSFVDYQSQDETFLSDSLNLANLNLKNLVSLEGVSYEPGLKPGCLIRLEESVLADCYPDYGDGIFRIVKITHRISNDMSYENSFHAIPSKVKSLPNKTILTAPSCHSQVAIVKDIKDPENKGRVKVVSQWDKGHLSPWLRVANQASGKNKQTWNLPGVEDCVLLSFEGNGNPEKPFVQSSFFHGGISPKWTPDQIGFLLGDTEVKIDSKKKKTTLKFGKALLTIDHKSGEFNFEGNTFKVSVEMLLELVAKLIKLN